MKRRRRCGFVWLACALLIACGGGPSVDDVDVALWDEARWDEARWE